MGLCGGERSPGASRWRSLSPNATARPRPPDKPAQARGARSGAALAPTQVKSTATRHPRRPARCPPPSVGPAPAPPSALSRFGGDPSPAPALQAAHPAGGRRRGGGHGGAWAGGCGGRRREEERAGRAPLTAALRGPARRPPPALPAPPPLPPRRRRRRWQRRLN